MKKTVLLFFFFIYSFVYTIELDYDFYIQPPIFNRLIFIPLRTLSQKETKEFKIIKDKVFTGDIVDSSIYNNNNLSVYYYPDLTKYYLMLLEKREKDNDLMLNISTKPITAYPKDKKIKIRFIFDAVVNNYQEDVESYAEIYIDKKNVGITEQKLLSQEKNFEFETSYEKHLLQVNIFIQDPLKKKWVRLKNIDQPKPIYFIPNSAYDNLYIKMTYYPGKNGNSRYYFTGSFLIDKKD
ncbi:MAG TPA: hypothetical protein PKW55_05080 [Spirochaetota bacterium]|nr:hypothetical protein [Spirochaetota bacterium]HOM37675.1 hypothetical protein [Spirochaetota bacterium]HPQ49633.1 hypothetical protein [Spirochaetota bacterium]